MIATVTDLRRLGTSQMGNPTYQITLTDADGDTATWRTKTDAGFAYALGQRWVGRQVHVTLERGKIANMREVEVP